VSENEIVFASRLLVLPGLFILGGFAVMVATVIRNGKVAELRHRERTAMIERELTPPEPAPGGAGLLEGDGHDRVVDLQALHVLQVGLQLTHRGARAKHLLQLLELGLVLEQRLHVHLEQRHA